MEEAQEKTYVIYLRDKTSLPANTGVELDVQGQIINRWLENHPGKVLQAYTEKDPCLLEFKKATAQCRATKSTLLVATADSLIGDECMARLNERDKKGRRSKYCPAFVSCEMDTDNSIVFAMSLYLEGRARAMSGTALPQQKLPASKKFVGYYRVSTTHQVGAGHYSFDAQRQIVRQEVETVGGELISEYEECASGTRSDREELTKAIQDCLDNDAALVVSNVDRLARDASLTKWIAGLVKVFACDINHLSSYSY